MRHFLKVRDRNPDEIRALVTRAAELACGAQANRAHGAIATVFYENSTRTRLSFQQAGEVVGLSHLPVSHESSSIQKGETLEDTLRTVQGIGAVAAAIRTPKAGSLEQLRGLNLGLFLVNAGDGWSQHPTQALGDLTAYRLAMGDVQGRRLLIVGDVLHSRVARSAADGFSALGAKIWFAGPPTLLPEGLPEALGGERVRLDSALRDADLVMVLRVQKERQDRGYLPSMQEYRHYYGLTEERYARLPEHARVMHPGPQNRGVEIDGAVITAEKSLIAEQVRCGVFARAALLEEVLSDAH